MRVVKNQKGFPAVLKDMQGCVLSEGFASVLQESGQIEFRSEFVPLHPMGVFLKVVRCVEGQEIHAFVGEVYISDRQLLRLVHVQDILLPGSENVYSTKVNFSGTFVQERTQHTVPEKTARFSLFHRKKHEESRPAHQYPLMVTAFSGARLEFTSPRQVEAGTHILVSFTPEPEVFLDNLPVEVEKVYAFGADVAYIGTFLPMPSWLQERLESFAQRLNERENRFFPQTDSQTQPEEKNRFDIQV